ncbi:MAG: PAS domain S-box protein, partial [Cyanobacteria bacterium P01_A01_bin.17]
MPPSTAQLQQDNKRLKTQCETLETELAELQQRYQAISRSEARYRQVVENSPISISFLSADGQHVEANAAFERMMGFTVEDSKRVGFNVFTDPALKENGTGPYMLRALAGETVIEPPTNFYDASQLYGKEAVEKYTPGQGHYFPIWDENGEVQEIVEMAPVVTDLLQVQAEAQAEREHAAAERAKLLSTVAQVANLLLRSQDYTTVMPDVVRLLGEAVGCDRCAITQEMLDNADHLHRVRLLNQWCREGIPSVLQGSPEFGQGIEIDSSLSFYQPLLKGKAVSFVVAEVEEPAWRDFFEAHHNVSMLIVPIMLSEDCWGHIGFDNCH